MKAVNHTQYYSLYYNHQFYEGKSGLLQLVNQLNASENKWQHEVALFLRQWTDDSSVINLQTSGSTGKPRIITVPKSSLVSSARRTLQFFSLKRGDKALLCLSAKYIAGKMMIVRAMVGGVHLIATGVQSNPLLGLDEPVDFAAMVPAQAQTVFENSKDQFRLVKTIILGGAKLNNKLAGKLWPLPTRFWETYGMTETVSHIALREISKQQQNPFTLLDGISIDVDDRSCLLVHPSDINARLLQTNDVVEIVNKRQFLLKGRYDNVIISGGIKIFPEEIEKKLEQNIRLSFIITGIPDNKWGETPVLVVESEIPIGAEGLGFDGLDSTEVPRKIFHLPVFPRTENGKIKRNDVKVQVISLIRTDNA